MILMNATILFQVWSSVSHFVLLFFLNLTSQQKDHPAYPVQQRTKYQQSPA